MNIDLTAVLPPWTTGYAEGDYTKIGAVLPTRDGNLFGNAVLMFEGQSGMYVDGDSTRPVSVYTIITDAGNLSELTLSELKDAFHPPIYITDIRDCPASRAYEYKKGIIGQPPREKDINNELLASLEETRRLLGLVTFLSRNCHNHPDKESVDGINAVLRRAREACELAQKSL